VGGGERTEKYCCREIIFCLLWWVEFATFFDYVVEMYNVEETTVPYRDKVHWSSGFLYVHVNKQGKTDKRERGVDLRFDREGMAQSEGSG
jgi:hypothetical protein